jgi:hypothetical protein
MRPLVQRSTTGAPGAFSAVIATGEIEPRSQCFATGSYLLPLEPIDIPVGALLPLPEAVLVHPGHRLDAFPVGVGVPFIRDDVIQMHAVMGRRAHKAWRRAVDGCGVSIVAIVDRGDIRRDAKNVRHAARAVLFAADLVPHGLDRGTRVAACWAALRPEELEAQRRFDSWLDEQFGPPSENLYISTALEGVSVLADELGDVVAPMRDLVAARCPPTSNR